MTRHNLDERIEALALRKVKEETQRLMRDLNHEDVDDTRGAFRLLITDAEEGSPTIITRVGKPVAVVVGYDDYSELLAHLQRLADGGEPG